MALILFINGWDVVVWGSWEGGWELGGTGFSGFLSFMDLVLACRLLLQGQGFRRAYRA